MCSSMAGNEVASLGEWAKAAGLGVGIVTTARITVCIYDVVPYLYIF